VSAASPSQRGRESADFACVLGPYRHLTPAQRADHIAILALLGRWVVVPPASPLHWRQFVVITADMMRQ